MEKYFCLVKDISPEDTPVTGRPRDVFEDMARVSPCIVVLPMGFSWSFYLVQALHENISLEALGKPRSDLILDGWPAPKLSESGVALMPYCDNVHCIGLDASLVQNSKDKVCAGLTNAGFELHEDVDATTFFPTLGGTLDGKLGQVRASNKRVWNLIYAFEFISMHIVTPRMVQQLLGHAMVVCVLNRSGMSVFRSLYDFVQQNGAPRRLNNKEIWECEVFIGILPLLFSDLRREWSPTITCTDASPQGYGVCERDLPVHQVRNLGRWQERWRFRRLPPDQWRPRERWGSRNPLSDPLTVCGGLEQYDDLEFYGDNLNFPEVSQDVLDPKQWATAKMGRWQNTSEHITLKEGRALVIAVRRLSRARRHRGKRHVVLVDNLALAFAVCKGRSNNFAMLRILQQLGALALAAELTIRPRWIPSEVNLSDGPSRGQIRPGPYVKVQQDPDLPSFNKDSKDLVSKDCSKKAREVIAAPSQDRGAQAFEERYPGGDTQAQGDPKGSKAKEVYPQHTHWRDGAYRQESETEFAHSAGKAQCEQRGPGAVRELLQQVQGLLPGERCSAALTGRRGRRLDGRLLGSVVPRRGDGGSRRKERSCIRVPPAPVQEQVAQKQAVSARLAQDGTSSKQVASSSSGHVWPSHAVDVDEQEDHGNDGGYQLRSLPQAWGSNRSQRSQHCTSHQKCWKAIPVGDSGCAGHRGSKARQDGSLRQQPCDQQQGDLVAGKGTGEDVQGTELSQRCFVSSDDGGLSEELHQSRAAAWARGDAPLPTASWGSHRGPDFRSQGSQCGQEPRKMENRWQCQKICKERQGSTALREDEPHPVELLPLGREKHGQSGFGTRAAKELHLNGWTDLFSPHVRPRHFALEIFAGTARISQALINANVFVYPIDLSLFPSHNVLDPHVADYIGNLICSSRVTLVWLGMPCTTFSRARKHDGVGPGPLRSPDHIWGLPGLRKHDRYKLAEGNELFGFTMHIIRLCLAYRVPFILENPLSSMAWAMPPLIHLQRQHSLQVCDLDFCQYGEIWKKPTRLLFYGIDISSLAIRCTGQKHMCSRTRRQHWPLTGRDASGVFWTLRAQPYPFALCSSFARLAARALCG